MTLGPRMSLQEAVEGSASGDGQRTTDRDGEACAIPVSRDELNFIHFQSHHRIA